MMLHSNTKSPRANHALPCGDSFISRLPARRSQRRRRVQQLLFPRDDHAEPIGTRARGVFRSGRKLDVIAGAIGMRAGYVFDDELSVENHMHGVLVMRVLPERIRRL